MTEDEGRAECVGVGRSSNTVHLHLEGTTRAFTDVMSLNRNDTPTTGDMTKHARYGTEPRRFTRRSADA
ncbi:MAG: hypothetical protein ABWY04_04410 [Arthrobacter sp.]